MTVVVADTPAAAAAYAAFLARTCTGDTYDCPCGACDDARDAEAAAEVRAEGAWLRAAEGDGHGYVEGCPCC